MPVPNGAQRASVRTLSRRSGWATLTAILVGIASAIALPAPAPAAAETAPKVAVIVGPVGSVTASYRDLANKAAAEARRYTPNVVRVYSPNATWSRVKAAINGAAIVVYLGRGRGYPSPYSTTLQRATQDGFGLNPVAGVNNSTTKYYGESYVRTVPLAPNAVVLLSHLSYASGNSEPGRPQPTRSVARRRVDNYGAGFRAAGASAVIAEASGSPIYYIRTIFTRAVTLDAMWRAAPTRHGHVTSFSSTRTPGAVGRTDPVYATSRYYRSIVGRLATSTGAVLGRSAKPTPEPAPTPVPTLVPAGLPVPTSIDATGATDASATLNTWLRTVPDGSTIVFKAGGVYRMSAALKFAHRHNLTFEGNGATLKAGGGTTEASSLFWIGSSGGGNTGIVIRNFTLVGNSPTPGVYQGGNEGAHGILVDGGFNIEIANVTVSAVWGDGIKITGGPNTVWFHDSRVVSAGRNGVTIGAGANITIEDSAFDKSGYSTFDIEPNTSDQTTTNAKFLNNTVGTWTNTFLSAWGAAGSVVTGVTVSGNTVTGKTLKTSIALARRQNVVFTNNTSLVAAAGPVLTFAYVDGLTVTGNVQPLRSGVLASITDCTGVVYR